MKLPKRLRFPGGYKVRIKVKRHDFFDYHAGLALWDEDRHKGGTVRLDETRTRKKLKTDLRHELGHVFVDWVDWYIARL